MPFQVPELWEYTHYLKMQKKVGRFMKNRKTSKHDQLMFLDESVLYKTGIDENENKKVVNIEKKEVDKKKLEEQKKETENKKTNDK